MEKIISFILVCLVTMLMFSSCEFGNGEENDSRNSQIIIGIDYYLAVSISKGDGRLTKEKLNIVLYEKMFTEQEKFCERLFTHLSDEILNYNYEYIKSTQTKYEYACGRRFVSR